MLLLAIETSCDETSVAILENKLEYKSESSLQPSFLDDKIDMAVFLNSFEIKSNIVSSQIAKHRPYGGVIPELSAREHTKNLQLVFLESIYKALGQDFQSGLSFEALQYLSALDLIAVTTNPGLASALKTGLEFAKSVVFMIQMQTGKEIPLVSVNHLNGHILSSFFEVQKSGINKNTDEMVLPHLHLLVSGGNTQLFLIEDWQDWQLLGQTLDDAVGECLDKVGRMLGLPYPAGIEVAKIAKLDEQNYCNFTVGMKGGKNNGSYDFSYSGHKTAVRYYLEKWTGKDDVKFELEKPLLDNEIQELRNFNSNTKITNPKLKLIYEVCVSAQAVVMKQLENRLNQAMAEFEVQSIGISGGVSANLLLRQKLHKFQPIKNLFIPDLSLTGDNAVMIALAGIFNSQIRT